MAAKEQLVARNAHKSGRTAKQALERDQNIAGTSTVPPVANPLQAAMDVLSIPVAPNDDVAATQAELDT
jgi:hypothetical protein